MSAISVQLDSSMVDAFLRNAPPRARTGVKNALRRMGTAVANEIIDESRKRGVMRQLFGKRKSGARKIIRRSRLRDEGMDIVQPIKIAGMAALQEEGGSTKGHVIKPKNAPKLVFRIQGRLIVTDKVNHPGAHMPPIPFAEKAAQARRAQFMQEIAKEVIKQINTLSKGSA